jgi:Mrp family chromosome partitioning ATPase
VPLLVLPLLQQDDRAVRGNAFKADGLIKQFVRDVDWGDLDYLVTDCPPGTGDEPLAALQTLGQEAQAVIVTTPQGVAVDDVRRSVTFCRQLGNPILGIV